MYRHETVIRVRYEDTDQMGAVYYGRYAAFFEVARVEALRSLGVVYKEVEEQGIIMPVLEYYTKYIKPAKYDELLTISTSISAKSSVRLGFEYEIHNPNKELINKGKTILAFLSKDTGRPCRMPSFLDQVLNIYSDDPQTIRTS